MTSDIQLRIYFRTKYVWGRYVWSVAYIYNILRHDFPALVLVSYLALRWVTLVLKGQMTARNLSHEMAERVITLDTMHSTDNIMVRLMVMDIIMVRAC